MFQTRSRWTRLGSWLLLLSGMEVVVGQVQSGRVNILEGKNGEDPCTLKVNIYEGCQITPPSSMNATFETPAACTCNREFFNIWSACTLATGNGDLPNFQDWNSRCTSSGINMDQGQVLADRNTWGVDSPDWARIDIPGNRTMDLQRAIVLVDKGPPKWTTLQKILPVITAVVAVIITVITMLLLQHRNSRNNDWRANILRRIKPIPRVQPIHGDEAWEIEPHNVNQGQTFEFTDMPHSHDAGVVKAYPFGADAMQQTRAQRPGNIKLDSYHDEPENSGSWLKGIATPWKKQPQKIQEVTPSKGFNISGSSKRETFGFSPTVESKGLYDGSGDRNSVLFSETDVTPTEAPTDSVMVIGNPSLTVGSKTNSTSANSNIQVESPSTESWYTTPRNALQPLAQERVAMPPVLNPVVPPLPNKPAPSAPLGHLRTGSGQRSPGYDDIYSDPFTGSSS